MEHGSHKTGILRSIYRSSGSNGEDEESSGEMYQKPSNGGYFRASLANLRKPKPILTVVSTRNYAPLQIQEISSPSSDLSLDSSPGATHVSPSGLEWQRNYSDIEIESHVNVDTYSPPSDFEWLRNYSHREIESHVNVDTYSPPSDLGWQWNYTDIEIESHVDVDTYSPPSDLEWKWNYSDIEIESHVDVDTYSPPSDLEWKWNYSDLEIESHVDVDTYFPPSDLEWQWNYSDIEIESHVNVDTYSPPSDFGLQRVNSISENEVYANAAWLQKRPISSTIWTEFVEDEDSNYIKQLDEIIDVLPSKCSLAHRNAFDIVDSAAFIGNEKIKLGPNNFGEKVEEEKVIKGLVAKGKWIKHYNSNHRILLVGEGDFSFSASLAVAFGSAPNMIATSLDSVDFLKKNYMHAMSNIGKLRSRECIVLHGIDATKVASHHLLGGMTFDRIIYNFPFAGFFKDLSREAQLTKHRRLVSLFLKNAKEMVGENGEIHITHKINDFHIEWKLESLASSHRLRLIEAVEFDQSDYKGYKTKCGFGGDNNFNCYPSKTYKFGLKRAQVHLLS